MLCSTLGEAIRGRGGGNGGGGDEEDAEAGEDHISSGPSNDHAGGAGRAMGCCRCRPAEGERRGWWKGSALGGRLGGALFCSFAACLLVLGRREG
jgi:hypothetical protein